MTDTTEEKPDPKPATPKRTPLIRWQKPMVGVLIALTPCMLSAIYRFGWRSLAVVAATTVPAFVAEWLFTRKRKEPVTAAVFVSGVLLAMILPASIPLWIAGVGGIVAIVFAKEAFGGFGRNIFNPALTGRCFLYMCFPNFMSGTSIWAQPASGAMGALTRWSTDAMTMATPLARQGAEALPTYLDLLLGNRSGCFGETMAVAILLGGLYLLWKKYADFRVVVSCIAAGLVATFVLNATGVSNMPDPLWTVLSGGFLFGAVFMVTDPVSSARNPGAKWAYGALVGVLTVILRRWGAFPEGMMFAILFMNIFNPLLDLIFPKKKRKTPVKAQTA